MHESVPSRVDTKSSLADELIGILADLGVNQAWGVIGGGCAPLADAIGRSDRVELLHARHESGAAFAALEASVVTGRPAVVFATTGPGVLNVLNGCMAARWDGARLILLSGMTAAGHRGRWPIQETSPNTMPYDGIYTSGALFHYATALTSTEELAHVRQRLASGLSNPSFVAHIGVPAFVQGRPGVGLPPMPPLAGYARPAPTPQALASIAALLDEAPVCVWVGGGARAAAPQVRALVEKIGAVAIASPRAKGVVDELHAQYAGVTGAGGHETVAASLAACGVQRTLVLGSRLGEATSFWDARLVPPRGFVHVDLDAAVPGSSYPQANTVAVHGDIAATIDGLLPLVSARAPIHSAGLAADPPIEPSILWQRGGPVRPRTLLRAMQRLIVDGSDAIVMSESGNAFSWANYYLRFSQPGRYRTNPSWGSMGHMTAGVVGAAHATKRKVVSLVGDGAMMMHNEINTAVQLNAPAVWVVLNDAAFGIVRDGMRAQGFAGIGTTFPRADFAMFARSMGAEGVVVDDEKDVDAALAQAMAHHGPFVVDVHVDTTEASPAIRQRAASLDRQQGRKDGAS